MKRERWQQVDEIVHAVLELDEPQRVAFLDRSCAGDPALRAEVEALLAADERAEDFLEQPAIRPRDRGRGPAAAGATHADRASEAGAGWSIGPYRVLRTLGEGGMGTVYLAARSDAEYERAVAIKVLRPGLHGRGLVRRFRSERQILATLDHVSIAKLHDGGTMTDGRPYLVMEYIAGTPIDRHVEAQGLGIRARLELFRRVCDAVRYAHQNLIVHLDIKPNNILVSDEGVPKLLDFGIAKLIAPDGAPPAGDATQTGLRPFTPQYASPEQLRGQPLTTASDVYSLGMVLYKLLTGRLPYHLTGLELAQQAWPPGGRELPRPSHVVGEAPATDPGSTTRPGRRRRDHHLRRQLASDLDSIVLKALRDEPQHRYGSAEQLATDLERYLDGRPVEARKGTAMYRMGKFLRRYRLAVAAVTAFVALVLTFAVSTALQAARLDDARRRAEQQQKNTEEVLTFLIGLFEVADPVQGAGSAATAKQVLDEGARRLDQSLDRQPEVQAKLRDTLGTIYINLGSYDRAQTMLEQALAEHERLFGPDDVLVASILSRLASVHLFQGRYDVAEPLYVRALDIRRRRLAPDHIDLAESLHNLASCYFFQNQIERARELYEQALQIARSHAGAAEKRLETAAIMGALANIYRAQKQHDRAERLYREVIGILQESHGKDHPDLAYAWNNLARVYIDMNDLDRAAPLLQVAAEMAENTQGAQHPHLAVILHNQGYVHEQQGDLARAEQLYLRALHILEASVGSDHPEICNPITTLLALYASMNRHDDAAPLRARFTPAQLAACTDRDR